VAGATRFAIQSTFLPHPSPPRQAGRGPSFTHALLCDERQRRKRNCQEGIKHALPFTNFQYKTRYSFSQIRQLNGACRAISLYIKNTIYRPIGPTLLRYFNKSCIFEIPNYLRRKPVVWRACHAASAAIRRRQHFNVVATRGQLAHD
jgi:hypothetical protein